MLVAKQVFRTAASSTNYYDAQWSGSVERMSVKST